jgi:hypothetical protein
MTIAETILGSLVVAGVSALIGVFVGKHNKVSSNTCDERREACRCFIAEKISSIEHKLDALVKLVHEKLLGL